METTERVVEAYCRYVKGWAIPNFRCDGQYEIDLPAIDPVTLERYHFESGSSSPGAESGSPSCHPGVARHHGAGPGKRATDHCRALGEGALHAEPMGFCDILAAAAPDPRRGPFGGYERSA